MPEVLTYADTGLKKRYPPITVATMGRVATMLCTFLFIFKSPINKYLYYTLFTLVVD